MELLDANQAALRLYRTDFEGLRTHVAGASRHRHGRADRAASEKRQHDGRASFRGIGTRADGSTFPEEVDVGRMRDRRPAALAASSSAT